MRSLLTRSLRGVVLAFAALVLAATTAAGQQLYPHAVGVVHPDFTALDENNQPFQLSAQSGKVVVLHFCALFCNPCRESANIEGALIDNLNAQIGAENWVFIDALIQNNFGDPSTTANALEWKTLGTTPTPAKTLHTEGNANSELALLGAQVAAFPTYVIIDTEGRISSIFGGFTQAQTPGLITTEVIEAWESRPQTALSPTTFSPGAPRVSGGNVVVDSTLDASGGPVMTAGDVTLFPGFVGQLFDAPAAPQFEVTVNDGPPLADGATVDFGTVGLGMPRTFVFTIRNLDSVPLTLSNFVLFEGFLRGVGAPDVSFTLGVDETIALPIVLDATDPGTFTGDLFFVNDENPDSSLHLSLTGTVLNQPHTTFTWNTADGDWDLESNWVPDQVPPPTKILNGEFYSANVFISNGGIARKTGGVIETGNLTISNGTLLLTDGADVENFYFIPGERIDRPLYLGENGILQIGEGGAPGGLLFYVNEIHETSDPEPGGTVVFNHDASIYTFSPRTMGTNAVRHEGPGTTMLAENDSAYTGGTTVTGGLLDIAANSAIGSSNSPLHLDGGGIRWHFGSAFNNLRAFTLGPNGGTLDTNGLSPSYDHVIPQTGPFSKTGTGTLILTQPHTVTTPWFVEGNLRFNTDATFLAGSSLSGSGIIELQNSTLTLDTPISTVGIQFKNSTSTLTGSADVTARGLLDFANEGKIRTTTPGSKLTVFQGMRLAAFSATFDGRVVELASDTEHISGTVHLLNGAVINNQADSTWTATGNNVINSGTFNNAGIFAKSGGTGTSTISSQFSNTGIVFVGSGTLSLESGGTFTEGEFLIADQAGLSLFGSYLFGSGVGFDGEIGSLITLAGGGGTTFETARVFDSDFIINGTTLTLDGETTFNTGVRMNNASSTLTGSGDIVVKGLLDFTNQGKIRTTAPGSKLTVQGGMRLDSFDATFDGRIFELASDTQHIRATLHLQNGAVFNNHAGSTWLETGNSKINDGTFNNAGTFTKNGGTGTSTISSAFTNTGTVNAMTGTLTFSGSYTQTSGTLHLNGGSIGKTGAPLDVSGGIVKGSGSIAGDLDVNGGRIMLEIGGDSPGVTHDQIVITGTTDFNTGIIEVEFIDDYAPQAGQEFVLLISAGLNGIPQIVVTGLAQGWQFATQYDPATDEFKLTALSDGVPGDGAQPLTISAPTLSPPPEGTNGKSVSTTASGPPGAVVRLEASGNLEQWNTLATETFDSSGNATFNNIHDPLAGDRRFYRLASP